MSINPDPNQFKPERPRFFCCHVKHLHSDYEICDLAMAVNMEAEDIQKHVNDIIIRNGLSGLYQCSLVHEVDEHGKSINPTKH